MLSAQLVIFSHLILICTWAVVAKTLYVARLMIVAWLFCTWAYSKVDYFVIVAQFIDYCSTFVQPLICTFI